MLLLTNQVSSKATADGDETCVQEKLVLVHVTAISLPLFKCKEEVLAWFCQQMFHDDYMFGNSQNMWRSMAYLSFEHTFSVVSKHMIRIATPSYT